MDLQLAFSNGLFDLSRSGADLASDAGLGTAVILSLFLDRRAEADDALPDGGDDRRGWWADAYAESAGDRLGSRLWLLAREKHLPAVAPRAQKYAEEALAWLLADGIAHSVRVDAQAQPGGRLALAVAITRPAAAPVTYRFANLWEALHAL